jgi:hypothetical protein
MYKLQLMNLKPMNKYLISLIVVVVVGFGLFAYFHQSAPAPVGGIYNTQFNPASFANGLSYTTIAGNMVNSSTTPAAILYTGTASTTPVAASVGHVTLGTGQTTQFASTTVVTANSRVVVQLEQNTPVAGVTCNTTLSASSTEATKVIYASSTNTSLNGFEILVSNAPVTNPFCFSYAISN